MALWFENGRKRLAALTSVRARDDFGPVLNLKATEGAANPGQPFRPDPCKPDGFLRIRPEALTSGFPRVKTRPIYEFTS